MNKASKIIIAIVAVVLVAIIAGYFIIGNMDVTLEGTDSKVVLPNTYNLSEDGLASKDNVDIMFIGVSGEGSIQTEQDFIKAIKANGNSSGYKNISEDTINGYKVYEYAVIPSELKTVKYGSSTKWTEYPPTNLTDVKGSKVDSHHYRVVEYVSPNNSSLNQLFVIAKDEKSDLYTQEIENIIHTISLKDA